MPDALELPGVLRAVVPFVSADLARVHEFVALAFGHPVRADQFIGVASGWVPGFAAIIGTLDDLTEPAAGLRGIQAIRLCRRTFEVINFPARKMRTADCPILAFAIRAQDERAF